MRKRLPLLVPAAAADASARGSSAGLLQTLGPASIGLADTEDGVAAAALTLQLAASLCARDVPVAIVLLGFQGVPALPAALRAQATALSLEVAAHAVDAAAPSLPAGDAAPDALTLWLGLPALASFMPTLAILLAADRPLTAWPAPLRARRGSFQLELSGPRAGLADALVQALSAYGFLLHR